MDKEQALKILAILTAAFPNTQIKKATAEIYIKFLVPMDFELASMAARRLIKTCQFFPTIKEITEAVEKFNPDQIPSADQAWDEVGNQLRRVGHVGIPQFSHDAIKEAVKVMGWINLCRSENVAVDRGQFMKIYESVKNRHKDNKINAQVLQLVSGNNGLLGAGK